MDKRIKAMAVLVLAALATACIMKDKKETSADIKIGKNDVTIKDGRLTPEDLWAMGRIGGVAVSPDGTHIAYQVSYYSVEANRSRTVIYVMDQDGSNVRLLTSDKSSENSPAWLDDKTIAFLSADQGSMPWQRQNPSLSTCLAGRRISAARSARRYLIPARMLKVSCSHQT